MPRRWRGTVTLENTQSGDGRVLAPGSVEWADLPLPLAWLRENDQHVDMTTAAPQIGTISALSRVGDAIPGEGEIDTDNPDGAEVVRRMEAGTAPLGNRFPISIDPDNWEVQIVATDQGDDEGVILLAAAGRGPLTSTSVREVVRSALLAAAGDPDPGDGGGEDGVVLFEDTVDAILERFTRIRVRGATLISCAAFDGAWIELEPEGAEADAPADEPPTEAVVAATPVRPPAAWFSEAEPQAGDERLVEQVDGSWAVPLTILDNGQVFGHIARAGQGHRGYANNRPTPPRSATGYREFHVGHVVCEGGEDIATGALIVGCDHAPLNLRIGSARDHYANSGLGWADGRVVDGEFGPWFSGVLRPNVTEGDLRVLRALSLSGDWRPERGALELCAVLSVNVPGFPIAREAMAASALCSGASCPVVSLPAAAVGLDESGEIAALVAAGMVTRCATCGENARQRRDVGRTESAILAAMENVQEMIARLDRRTRHLEPVAASALRERVHANGR